MGDGTGGRSTAESKELEQVATEVGATETRADSLATESLTTESLATATLSPRTLASARRRQELQHGDSLGRYLVLELVGQGSMGQVYSAYDPKLDRKVALKVLPEARQREALQSRLIREARALAQLSHPNVVSVFDAETVDGEVFIATEFVVGQTFAEWLQAPNRARTEILSILVDAGRGLAAAHEAGLVHRDFKASNIMVANNGQVVVLDFGLARQLGDRQPSKLTLTALEQELSWEPTRTRTGAVLGTPAFMAPEQRQGAEVGPAADQFSFCAVAFHALTGVLPASDSAGTAAATLPPRLRSLLEHGMAESSDERHASMSVLLDKLTREGRRGRRRWQWAMLGLTVLALAVGWWQFQRQQQAQCGAGIGLFQEVWNAQRQASLRTSLLSGGTSGGKDGVSQGAAKSAVWQSVVDGLDTYAGSWAEMYRQTCEASQNLGQQSPELFDLRMDCLEQRRREVDVALDILANGMPGRLEIAPRWISHLPPLTACRDTRALRSPSPPPRDPDSRRQLNELRDGLAAVKAQWLVGDYESGRQAADDLSRAAHDFGYWPLTAEVLMEKARFLESQGEAASADQALVDTLLAAQAGGHARIAAEALVRRVRVQGYLERRFEDAAVDAAQAKSVLERLSEPAALSAELDEVRGLLAIQRGHFDEARQLLESALDTKQGLHGASHLQLAPTLSRLGDVALQQGRLDDAQPLLERALAINRLKLGSDHPNVAGTLAQLGVLAVERGAFEAALAHHSVALDIRRQVLGEQHPRVAMSLADIANALSGLGRFTEAVEHFEQSVQLFEQRLGPDHPFVAIALSNLAAAHIRQSRPTPALPLYQKALEIQRRHYGEEHPRTLQAAFNFAETLRHSGSAEAAIRQLEEVIQHLDSQAEAPSSLRIDARTSLGEAFLDLGQAQHALPHLAAALAARPKAGRRPDLWAKNAFALARALGALDQQPQQASELAHAALDKYRQRSTSHSAEIEAVEEWLEERLDVDG